MEVDWLVVKDPGDVRLAYEGLVMSRDVVEECWCLTIALVLHGGCHDRRVEEVHWDRGNAQELIEGKCSWGRESSMALELLS